MWIELSNLWIVVLNLVAIPGIHFGLSWAYTRMPVHWFNPRSRWFREEAWEKEGAIYDSVFAIRKWKGLLPDAAPWFGGFAKGKLSDKDPDYIARFIIETCRGEAAHWAQVIGIWLTILWNPWPVAALVMLVYGVISNLPCLLLQRFTRARLRRLLSEITRET
ncbi:MAG: hypothetical protein AAGA96_01690 [Verrucomicrobiota bacterium]